MEQTAIEWYIEQINICAMKCFHNEITVDQFHVKRKELEKEAIIIYNDKMLFSYSNGYDKGYERALECMQWKIENELKITNK
jgi:hypothetical protein